MHSNASHSIHDFAYQDFLPHRRDLLLVREVAAAVADAALFGRRSCFVSQLKALLVHARRVAQSLDAWMDAQLLARSERHGRDVEMPSVDVLISERRLAELLQELGELRVCPAAVVDLRQLPLIVRVLFQRFVGLNVIRITAILMRSSATAVP